MKLYFQEHDENCYSLQYHYQFMKDNDIKEMKVFEAKREKIQDISFAKNGSQLEK